MRLDFIIDAEIIEGRPTHLIFDLGTYLTFPWTIILILVIILALGILLRALYSISAFKKKIEQEKKELDKQQVELDKRRKKLEREVAKLKEDEKKKVSEELGEIEERFKRGSYKDERSMMRQWRLIENGLEKDKSQKN